MDAPGDEKEVSNDRFRSSIRRVFPDGRRVTGGGDKFERRTVVSVLVDRCRPRRRGENDRERIHRRRGTQIIYTATRRGWTSLLTRRSSLPSANYFLLLTLPQTKPTTIVFRSAARYVSRNVINVTETVPEDGVPCTSY